VTTATHFGGNHSENGTLLSQRSAGKPSKMIKDLLPIVEDENDEYCSPLKTRK